MKCEVPAIHLFHTRLVVFCVDLADPESEVRKLLGERFSIRRSPALGTKPSVYYLV